MTMENKLHLAPILNPKNVLDIATGTGIWAIEFGNYPERNAFTIINSLPAEQYPSSQVFGTDLSPIQPV